jgi:hypothetical protein
VVDIVKHLVSYNCEEAYEMSKAWFKMFSSNFLLKHSTHSHWKAPYSTSTLSKDDDSENPSWFITLYYYYALYYTHIPETKNTFLGNTVFSYSVVHIHGTYNAIYNVKSFVLLH